MSKDTTSPQDVADNLKVVAKEAGAAAGKAAAAEAMETNSFLTKEDLPEPMETNGFATKEDIQTLSQQIETMETNSQASVEDNKITSLREAFDVFETNKLVDDEKYVVEFETNAASTYTPSTGADSAPGREDRQLEIDYDPLQDSIAMMFKMVSGNGSAYRINRGAGTSAAAARGHGDAFGRTTLTVNDDYITYRSIGHILTAPEEDMADTDRLEMFFNDILAEQKTEAVNSQILTGDGTGDNIQGIANWSTPKTEAAFDTFFGSLANDYGTLANEIDVTVASKQSLMGDNFGKKGGGFKMLVNPEFTAKVQGLKSTRGEYILSTAYDPAGNERTFLAGVEIMESAAVASDTFYMWHDSALKFVTRQGTTIKMGYDGDDFGRNNRSVKVYGRYALVATKPGTGSAGGFAGICNGTFTNAIASLNA